MKKIFSFILLFILLTADILYAGLRTGDQAPTFSLRDREGNDFYLSHIVGVTSKKKSEGVILSFFATWCKPCKKELPLINSLVDNLNEKNIQVIIVGMKEDFNSILPLLSELGVDKPIILSDRYGKVSEKYHIRSLPVTFFIGADGRIKDIIYGEISNVKKFNMSVSKLLR